MLIVIAATMVMRSPIARFLLQAGVRLLVDAEQSHLQPAIDLFALELQRQFNAQQPVVYNTFQAYRKDTHQRYSVRAIKSLEVYMIKVSRLCLLVMREEKRVARNTCPRTRAHGFEGAVPVHLLIVELHPPCRLLADSARADAEGWRFGAKLVRGAYMVSLAARGSKDATADCLSHRVFTAMYSLLELRTACCVI
jgi:Proline dehydrogenase